MITFCVPPFKLSCNSCFNVCSSTDLFKLSPKVFLFNLTTFGLAVLFTELFSWPVLDSKVGKVALMETELIPLLIDSREAGFLLILIMLLCSFLAILLSVPPAVSSDFLQGKRSAQS